MKGHALIPGNFNKRETETISSLFFFTKVWQVFCKIWRHNLDFRDIYDRPDNFSFTQKIKSVYHKTALGIICAIKGSSREKIVN